MQALSARVLGYRQYGQALLPQLSAACAHQRQPRGQASFSSASPAVPNTEITSHTGNTHKQRERELILSVLSTVPSPREARKFLNSVSGNETMRNQREFEVRQARLATEQPAVRNPRQLVPGEIHRNAYTQINARPSETHGAAEVVPRRLTAAVFVDGLDSDRACANTGKLLAQIQRIGVTPVVLLTNNTAAGEQSSGGYRGIIKRIHQLSDAIEKEGGKARPINEGVFFNNPYAPTDLSVDPELIGAAILQGQMPIISPLMADSTLQVKVLKTQLAAPALARALSLSTSAQHAMAGSQGEFSLLLARLILLGTSDGLTSADNSVFHRFVNLEEDYREIAVDCKQTETLDLMRTCLGIMPPTAAGIVASLNSDPSLVLKGLISERPVSTQHKSAAQRIQHDRDMEKRRQLQHKKLAVPNYQPLASYPYVNIGKPASSSNEQADSVPTPTQFTLLRHGFRIERHTTVDTCDLPRLRSLLESSFKRTLDGGRYFDRLRALENAGGMEIIIAGDYQGAVIVTHEPLPGSQKYLPYLDKFAVLPSAQGTGMADILWTQLRRTCPSCMWRSRNDNGVNKWYFDRSSGHCRSPPVQPGTGTRWVFFWYQSQAPGQRTLTMDEICTGINVSQNIAPSFV
ncbi:Amino-acid acetyltransferase, mitochondrial [Coemansia sp. RSA 2336]|nr:Amino-acid acetyltransferase, mitochondrial [Coemansia sp. RSA 2336]